MRKFSVCFQSTAAQTCLRVTLLSIQRNNSFQTQTSLLNIYKIVAILSIHIIRVYILLYDCRIPIFVIHLLIFKFCFYIGALYTYQTKKRT